MIYVCNVSYEHERVRLTQKVRISEKSRDADRDFLLNFVTPIVIFFVEFRSAESAAYRPCRHLESIKGYFASCRLFEE